MTTDKILTCIVADDEPLAAQMMAAYVERTPFLELKATCNNATEVLEAIGTINPDLLFLDIRMPGMSGIELAKALPADIKVIFTTAYADHALDGFRVHAFDYLLKPVSYDDFLRAALRAKPKAAVPSRADDEFLTVRSEYRLLRLPIKDIEYAEGLKDYVKIFMVGEAKPILTLMSLAKLEESLPPSLFMRVHRSYIVNLSLVRVVERNSIIIHGSCIPISESYRARFMERLGI